jgi:hypothetical protein
VAPKVPRVLCPFPHPTILILILLLILLLISISPPALRRQPFPGIPNPNHQKPPLPRPTPYPSLRPGPITPLNAKSYSACSRPRPSVQAPQPSPLPQSGAQRISPHPDQHLLGGPSSREAQFSTIPRPRTTDRRASHRTPPQHLSQRCSDILLDLKPPSPYTNPQRKSCFGIMATYGG